MKEMRAVIDRAYSKYPLIHSFIDPPAQHMLLVYAFPAGLNFRRENQMKKATVFFAILLLSTVALSQRPSDPALLVPQEGPALNLTPVPNPLSFPAGTAMGFPGDIAVDSKGHLWVISRPAANANVEPVVEFDENGKYVRSFGKGVFGNRPHGITFDPEGNIWVSDSSAHIVVKFNAQGEVLLTLGTRGQRGQWD